MRSSTGEPLDRARVTLQRIFQPPTGAVATPSTPPPPIPPVQTLKDGKFSFKDLEPGQYRLRVQRNGYAGRNTASGLPRRQVPLSILRKLSRSRT
jgi:hypothetical protein